MKNAVFLDMATCGSYKTDVLEEPAAFTFTVKEIYTPEDGILHSASYFQRQNASVTLHHLPFAISLPLNTHLAVRKSQKLRT
jgi:hypothetical protein